MSSATNKTAETQRKGDFEKSLVRLEEVVKRVEVRRRAEGKKSEQSGSTDRAST